jgi:hypothetical protein
MMQALQRFHKMTPVLGVILSLAIAFPASGAVLNFFAHLNGAQEVPPNPSPATGTSTIVVDTDANTMTVSLHFQGLLSSQTAAHLHGPAPAGQNAGVLVGFPLGEFDGQLFNITDTIEGHIINGLTYVNVHTQGFPGGEIRGQVLESPVSVEANSWSQIKALYR